MTEIMMKNILEEMVGIFLEKRIGVDGEIYW